MFAKIVPHLRNKPNQKKEHPIVLRITKDRKSSIISTGLSVSPEHWDKASRTVKKSHTNSAYLNAVIAKKLSEVQKQYLITVINDKETTARSVSETARSQKMKNSFFGIADRYLENLRKERKFNQLSSDKSRVKHFRTFVRNERLAFQEITVALLRDFKAYLKGGRGMSERSAVNSLVVIRTIFNIGINSGLVDPKYYPFGKSKIRIKFPESKRIGLSREEVFRIERIDLAFDRQLDHARNIWLTSFYFAGARISDVLRLRWSDIRDERLYYTMGKNRKIGSLAIPDPARVIFSKYKAERSEEKPFIFPELNQVIGSKDPRAEYRVIKSAIKNINTHLETIASMTKIYKKLTMHVARHTFGNISGDRIPIQLLQKLYRHSHISTTVQYQQSFTSKDTDDALAAVLKLDH